VFYFLLEKVINRGKSRIERLRGFVDSPARNSSASSQSLRGSRRVLADDLKYNLKGSELLARFAYGIAGGCLYFMPSLSRNLQNLRNYVINTDESERSVICERLSASS